MGRNAIAEAAYRALVMGDVINLNHYRKRRERLRSESDAVANRTRTGRKKIERDSARRDSERHRQELDGKLIDLNPGDDQPA